jgi:4-aminobutyrate aminotransferase-like enzyme/aminoglycoside phosphotransferase (APT) family kinase protein
MIEDIKRSYGFIPASIKELDGDINYSNRKYLIENDSGNKYILKIYTDREELEIAKEENRILEAIKDKLEFDIPVAQRDLYGNSFTRISGNEAIMLKYIEGEFIANLDQTDKIIYDLGECIGNLHLALKEQESRYIEARINFWDLKNSYINYDKSEYIKDPSLKKHVDYYFNRFHTRVLPEIHKLRYSLIHGDLNDYNILYSGEGIKGFIDFGDFCYSPLINELAIAGAYIMMGKSDPLHKISELIRGFIKTVPLERSEIMLLPDLICTRLCVSICNSAEKKAKSQGSDYVLISEKPAIKLLTGWKEISDIKYLDSMLEAAGLEQTDKKISEDKAISRRYNITGKALSLSYRSPIYMAGSLFQYMYDKKGNTYLDAYNNIPHVGHSHPYVARAISRQSDVLNTNTRYLYDSLLNYGENLLELFPEKLNRAFFVNSGSAASDLAIRMAKNHTGRDHVLVMDHGYHGNTTTGINISPYKFDGKGGRGLPDGITKLPLPNTYTTQISGKDHANKAITLINSLIASGTRPAAYISEPISGCGGQVPLAGKYLKTLYPYLEKAGIVTISDEVQVGFGRLGRWFWGFDMHGVIPDIVVLGKPMGNGHPIGAVVTTAEIAESFSNGMEFFSSFGGNPVSCEAAGAVLDIIKNEGLQQNAEETGNYYLHSLKQLAAEHPIIGDVRGSGLFIGIEFTLGNGKPGTLVAGTVKNRLKERFILTGTDGPYDNVIKSKPPLCFSRPDVDRVVNEIDRILKDL